MRLAKQLQHFVKTKGVLHGLERPFQVLFRFSRGRGRFEQMIESLEQDLPGLKVTFCAAASLLEHHYASFEKLQRAGHEFAAHGFFHSRMDYLDAQRQAAILEESYLEFERAGFEVSGFRCPYLNFNQDTIDALQRSRYDWTSQEILFWNNGFHRGVERLKRLYHTKPVSEAVSIPFPRGRVLEVPITAPDDEIVIERMRVRSAGDIQRIWVDTFNQVHERGELCHLLFHPERYPEVVPGLRSVLETARSAAQPVWIATLDEICDWWLKRTSLGWSCTGDAEAGWSVKISLPPGATMLLKKPSSDQSEPFYRDYGMAQPARSMDGAAVYELAFGPRPTIGVDPDCPDWIEQFLGAEGFLIERSPSSGGQAMQIGPEEASQMKTQRSVLEHVESCPHPLYRVWRWPGGARSALTVSSDVDAITLGDFWRRVVNF